MSVSGGEPSEWKTLIQLSYLKGDAGETPEFRKGDTGLEWKYKSEEDTSWRSLIAIDDLRWHFTDLTKDQIAELWHELPDDVLTEFQAPALEAAEVANAGADRANAAAEATEQTNVEVCEQEAERIIGIIKNDVYNDFETVGTSDASFTDANLPYVRTMAEAML